MVRTSSPPHATLCKTANPAIACLYVYDRPERISEMWIGILQQWRSVRDQRFPVPFLQPRHLVIEEKLKIICQTMFPLTVFSFLSKITGELTARLEQNMD